MLDTQTRLNPATENRYLTTAKHIAQSLNSRRFRSSLEWADLGVKVQTLAGDLPRDERETTLSFTGLDRTVDVSASHSDWQRRLEESGAVPLTITAFEKGEGQIRWYRIPREWLKLPYAPSGNSRGNPEALQKAREARQQSLAV